MEKPVHPSHQRNADTGGGGPSAEPGTAAAVRLNKLLAERGVASRRKCDEMIAAGKVNVDGRIVTELGTKVDPARQRVEVGGRVLEPSLHRRYYLLNKPRGVICTNEPREARLRAIDLILDPDAGRIFSVGRLDEDSEGLLLLTNDGEFAQRVSHPRYGVSKTYRAKIRGRVDGAALEAVRQGVHLAEGRTGGALLRVTKRSTEFTIVEVTIGEGKNREVRRIFAHVGFKVLRLKRIAIGPVEDRRLKEGQWRPLLRWEIEALESGERAARRPRPARRPFGSQGHSRPPPRGARDGRERGARDHREREARDDRERGARADSGRAPRPHGSREREYDPRQRRDRDREAGPREARDGRPRGKAPRAMASSGKAWVRGGAARGPSDRKAPRMERGGERRAKPPQRPVRERADARGARRHRKS